MAEEEKETGKSLNFQFFTRNDQAVRERLRAHDYDWASETGLGNLDFLFSFLMEMDFFSLFDFRPEGRQRVMIPLVQLLSTYSAGVLCEMSSLNQIDTELFKDRALLEKLGFTGLQIERGVFPPQPEKAPAVQCLHPGQDAGGSHAKRDKHPFCPAVCPAGQKAFCARRRLRR